MPITFEKFNDVESTGVKNIGADYRIKATWLSSDNNFLITLRHIEGRGQGLSFTRQPYDLVVAYELAKHKEHLGWVSSFSCETDGSAAFVVKEIMKTVQSGRSTDKMQRKRLARLENMRSNLTTRFAGLITLPSFQAYLDRNEERHDK